MPDQVTADAIVAASATVYSDDQITSELEIDATVGVVELTLTGTMSNIENKMNLVAALDDVENVEVIDDDLDLVTTTTRGTVPPTRRPATTRPPTTAGPTTTAPPIATQSTNPGLG